MADEESGSTILRPETEGIESELYTAMITLGDEAMLEVRTSASDAQAAAVMGQTSEISEDNAKLRSAQVLKTGKKCEVCEENGKVAPQGLPKARRCLACDVKREVVVENVSSQEAEVEETASQDVKEEIIVDGSHITIKKKLVHDLVVELKRGNGDDDEGLEGFCTDGFEREKLIQSLARDFAMVVEHPDVMKPSISATKCEDARKSDSSRSRTPKNGATPLTTERMEVSKTKIGEATSTEKAEKNGYSKARFLVEKEAPTSDIHRSREEQELEKRERGWVSSGRGNVLKVVSMKNASITDERKDDVPRKERAMNVKERAKVKSLREKPDTQRILGLISRRSESRVTSPGPKRNEKVKRVDASDAITLNPSTITGESSKLQLSILQTAQEQHILSSNAHPEHDASVAPSVLQSEEDPECAAKIAQTENDARRSRSGATTDERLLSALPSPTNTSCRVNDNPLYGTNSETESSGDQTSTSLNEPHTPTSSPPNEIETSGILQEVSQSIQSPQQSGQSDVKEGYVFLTPRLSSTYVSPDFTPIIRSARASPTCKSPEPTPRPEGKTEIEVDPLLLITPERCKQEKVDNDDAKKLSISANCNEHKKAFSVGACEMSDLKGGKSSEDNSTNFLRRKLQKKTRSPQTVSEEKEVSFKNEPEVMTHNKKLRSQTLLWPAHMLIRAVSFQCKVVMHVLSFLFWLSRCLLSATLKPFAKMKGIMSAGWTWIKEPVKEQEYVVTSRQKIKGEPSHGQGNCRCVAGTYIMLVLSTLIIPTLFDLDFFLVNKFVEGQVSIREILHFDYTKSQPVAVINLLPPHIMGKAKGFSFHLPDKEILSARAFPASHKFHVTIYLTVPESEYNHQIGMFQALQGSSRAMNEDSAMFLSQSTGINMHDSIGWPVSTLLNASLEYILRPCLCVTFEIRSLSVLQADWVSTTLLRATILSGQMVLFQVTAELFSVRGHLLDKASRPSMLRFYSTPLRLIKTFIMGLPVLLGLAHETQTLAIRVMDSQYELPNTPTASIKVMLEPRAGSPAGFGVPEIYRAELQVVSRLPWIREVARSWLWTLYLWTGSALFGFEALLVIGCCRRAFPKGKKICGKNLMEEDGVGQGSKKHVNFQDRLPRAVPSSSEEGEGSKSETSLSIAAGNDVKTEEIEVERVTDSERRTQPKSVHLIFS